jgi:hypothetical protein
MKETLSSSETSVLTRVTRRNIRKDTILYFNVVQRQHRTKNGYLALDVYIIEGSTSDMQINGWESYKDIRDCDTYVDT